MDLYVDFAGSSHHLILTFSLIKPSLSSKVFPSGNLISFPFKVNTKDYELYPYMDTFIFYDADEGKLSNSQIFQRPYAQLDETEGEPDWRT